MQRVVIFLGLLLITLITSCGRRAIPTEQTSTTVAAAIANDDEKKHCEYPLFETIFKDALKFLEQEKNSLKRMELAKKLAQSECLNVSQVIRISRLFAQEKEVMEYAVFAFPFVYNPSDYAQFKWEFKLQSNRETLEELLH